LSWAGQVTNVFDWAPANRGVLVGCSTPQGVPQVCELPVDPAPGSPDIRVIASDPARRLSAARTSPNGRWLSFVAHVSGSAPHRTSIYLMRAGGGPWIPVTEGAVYDDKPRWTADSGALYYLSLRAGFWNVWRLSLNRETGRPVEAPTQVTFFNSPARTIADDLAGQFQYSVTRDRVILPVAERNGAIWVLENADR
jgi:hypothetical protein